METAFSTSVVFSLALIVIAVVWISKYGSARKARKYSEGRETIVRDERFKTLGRIVFVASNLLTLVSFWTHSPALLSFSENHELRVAGMIVLIAATLLQVNSMKQLGENYSPCFDSHRPLWLVKQGPYKYVRHPVYLANILLGVGYSLASCSVWVLALSGYGVFKMVKAMGEEESYLSKTFPGYEKYRAKTARLIPFIY